jgi:hypothetical protein
MLWRFRYLGWRGNSHSWGTKIDVYVYGIYGVYDLFFSSFDHFTGRKGRRVGVNLREDSGMLEGVQD